MESFALHSLSTTATSTFLSHHHPSRLSLLRRTSSRSPPPCTISLRSHSVQSLSFPLLKPIPRFSTRIAAVPQDNAPPPPPPSPAQGAKLVPLILSISVGLILRFAVAVPEGVTPQGWQLLSIFLSTPSGSLGVHRSHRFNRHQNAFVLRSFLGSLSSSLVDSLKQVSAIESLLTLWKSTLGLSYGLTLSEALIAPAMPSTTARAGGIFLPIIKSLSLSAAGDPSSRKLGSYLRSNLNFSAPETLVLFS